MVNFIFSLLFICLSANATYSPSANIFDSSGGTLNSTSNALNVDVTNFPGTQAVTQSGTWNLGNIAGTITLPTGAATSAKQPTLGTAGSASTDVLSIQGIASMTALKVDGSAVTQPVSGTFFQATQPVSAASLPLPTGASTSANQSTEISSLSSIDGKMHALGQNTMSASMPVAIASDQSYGSQTTGTTTGTGTLVVTLNGASNVTVYASDGGSYAGTTVMEGSVDGTNWINIFGADIFNLDGQLYGSITTSPILPRILQFNTAGMQKFRARANGATGTLTLAIGTSQSPGILSSIQNFLFSTSKTQDGSGTAITSSALPGVSKTGLSVAVEDSTATGAITTQNLNPNSGTATAASTISVVLDGQATVGVQVTGVYTGALTPQVTVDNANWIAVASLTNANTNVTSATITSATVGIFQVPVTGYKAFRISANAAVTGTATVSLRATQGTPSNIINNVGTVATVTGVTTVSTVTAVTTLANGQTAHSAASTGSPVRVAGRVNTAVDTTLVAGDVSDLFMTSGGALVEKPYSMPETDWQYTSGLAGITTTTSTQMKAAGAAGVRNYVTGFSFQNTSITASTIAVLDGASVIWSGNAPASMLAPTIVNFPTPLRGTAATAMNVQLTTTSTLTMVNSTGYQAP